MSEPSETTTPDVADDASPTAENAAASAAAASSPAPSDPTEADAPAPGAEEAPSSSEALADEPAEVAGADEATAPPAEETAEVAETAAEEVETAAEEVTEAVQAEVVEAATAIEETVEKATEAVTAADEAVESAAAEGAAELTEIAETASAEAVAAVTETVEDGTEAAATASDAAEAASADVVMEATEAAAVAEDAVAEASEDVVDEVAEAVAAVDEAVASVDEVVAEAPAGVVEEATEAAAAADEAVAEAPEDVVDEAAAATEAATEAESPGAGEAESPEAAEAVVEAATAEATVDVVAPSAGDAAPAVAPETADGATVEATDGAPASDAQAQDAAAENKAAADAEHAAEIARLREAMTAKVEVQGKIIGWNKGGYHVAIGKVAAFCPLSQIELGNPRSPKRYVDQSFSFHILEIQGDGRRVVVSRAAALRKQRAEETARIRSELEKDAILKGRVSSITDFGAFVNLGGGVEGLVHVSEISRQRVEHAKDVLNVGQEVEVKVLKIEKGGKRISLSMKRLEPDPWKGVAERFPPGSEFTGKIARRAEFGAFIEVEPGLEGLVHTSRLPIGKKLEDEAFADGAEVQGWVQEVDRRRQRLSLSLRPVATGNPWKGVAERYPEGDVVEGRVERVADFGAFIELEPGLTGLLPFSMLAGSGNPKRQYQAGREVKVKVLAIDKDRKRISLGTEQSTAEGNQQDYREYVKAQRDEPKASSGMSTLAAAFERARSRDAD
ncbi:MAG: S1 RNA-binding domain-containing protein [Acidobacteriota bacterium]